MRTCILVKLLGKDRRLKGKDDIPRRSGTINGHGKNNERAARIIQRGGQRKESKLCQGGRGLDTSRPEQQHRRREVSGHRKT